MTYKGKFYHKFRLKRWFNTPNSWDCLIRDSNCYNAEALKIFYDYLILKRQSDSLWFVISDLIRPGNDILYIQNSL